MKAESEELTQPNKNVSRVTKENIINGNAHLLFIYEIY